MSAYVCSDRKSTLKDHLRWPLLKILIAASLNGCLVGFNTVFLYYLLPLVKSDLGINKSKIFEAVMVIIGYLSKVIGMVIAICIMDSFGRHKTIYWAAITLAFGAGLTLVFPWIHTMMIGRFIIVAAEGAGNITIPVYISELTPNRVRGMIMTFQLVPAAIGQVLGHCVSDVLTKVLGNWKLFVLVESIICITYIYAMSMASETPRFLNEQAHLEMDVDKHAEAVDIVRRIWPPQDVEVELYRLQSVIEEEIEESGSMFDDMNQKPFSNVRSAWREEATRRALLTWLLCISLSQLCGVDFVLWYNSTFTKATWISQEMSYLHGSIVVCWLKMTGSAMGACFLDIYGICRKDVLQVFFVGMITANGAVSVLLHGKTELSFFYGSIVLGSFIFSLGSYYIGHRVAATIDKKACPLRFRGVGGGAVVINWAICNHIIAEISVLIGMTFTLDEKFSALFLLDLILLGLMWRYLPNTSAMPLESGWKTLKDLKRSNGERHTS